ncbi:MAG: hypothetical protein M3R61_09315, partial [Chloroflexota bacterium]|nr:hypothetical protein [Chloroflexota bacterium]
VVLSIPSVIVFAIAMWLMYRAVYQHLPNEAGKPQLESDFWELVNRREASRIAQGVDYSAET